MKGLVGLLVGVVIGRAVARHLEAKVDAALFELMRAEIVNYNAPTTAELKTICGVTWTTTDGRATCQRPRPCPVHQFTLWGHGRRTAPPSGTSNADGN